MATFIAGIGVALALLAAIVKFARAYQREWNLTFRMLDPLVTLIGAIGAGAYLGVYFVRAGAISDETVFVVGFGCISLLWLLNIGLLIDGYNRRRSGDHKS